jgi:two-component system, NarL family, response regulator LiaR
LKKIIRILIADDHKVVREGLKAFLAPIPDFLLEGEAADGLEAVEMAALLHPDVILLDLMMPGRDGIGAVREILKTDPTAKVIIITSFMEDTKVIEAIRAGAAGYFLKEASPLEIETAIRDVHRGETAFPSKISNILVKEINRPSKPEVKVSQLTDREMEILKLIARGKSNQDIADEIFLSVWTVRTYVTGILDKLGLENRTQAALFAVKSNLVRLEE